MKNKAQIIIISIAVCFIFVLCLNEVNAMEYTHGELISIYVSNATTGLNISGQKCNMTIINGTNNVFTEQLMADNGDGTYSFAINDSIVVNLTGKYTAFAMCNIGGRDWRAYETFYVVDSDSLSKIDLIKGRNITQNLTAIDIWEYSNRSLTESVNVTQSILDNIASAVWSYGTRTLTSFGTLIADIWAYVTRTLTNYGSLVADIWNNPERNITTGIWGTTNFLNATQEQQLENATFNVTVNVSAPINYYNSTMNIIIPE